jgi:hypothetical protein
MFSLRILLSIFSGRYQFSSFAYSQDPNAFYQSAYQSGYQAGYQAAYQAAYQSGYQAAQAEAETRVVDKAKSEGTFISQQF